MSTIEYQSSRVTVTGSGLSSSPGLHVQYLSKALAEEVVDSKVFRSGDISWEIQSRRLGGDLSQIAFNASTVSQCQTSESGDLLVAFRSPDDQSVIEVIVTLPGEDDFAFVATSDGFDYLEVIVTV